MKLPIARISRSMLTRMEADLINPMCVDRFSRTWNAGTQKIEARALADMCAALGRHM